eukprot:TRINITY_DN8166_c0_g1_i1.p3 TRINITY_DN8166_c0_g1~~TRINITY_DN8166_c0_g1_i1.p3  ORF type:complete len:126 (-),score=6.72 TRINITY_DN8166_c0_g1_i1:535-912(-)
MQMLDIASEDVYHPTIVKEFNEHEESDNYGLNGQSEHEFMDKSLTIDDASNKQDDSSNKSDLQIVEQPVLESSHKCKRKKQVSEPSKPIKEQEIFEYEHKYEMHDAPDESNCVAEIKKCSIESKG